MRKALISGITGMAGSHMADYLLAKGYTVYGLIRRTSMPTTSRISHIEDAIGLLSGDLMDPASIEAALRFSQPNEIYNFGGQSFVSASYKAPIATLRATGEGFVNLIEAAKLICPEARIFQASSSEMFGNAAAPQSEATPLIPESPYGAAKVYAHNMARIYREAYGLHISCAISYNHEGERRGHEFVTRKITRAIGMIKAGQQNRLELGNLSARRDWMHAEDVVHAAWLMLQQDKPDDYVLATGITHTIQEFLEAAFSYASLDYHNYVHINPSLFRPTEVNHLQGCAAKAQAILGWKPEVSFMKLVHRMVDHDIAEAQLSHPSPSIRLS